jgi:hypothetical protein
MPATPEPKERFMKRKSVLALGVLAAGVLFSLLLPSQAAASCFCLSERFNASGSALGGNCSQAQSNLINHLTSSVDQSCVFRGYSGACNIAIRTGFCGPDPFNPGLYRADGTAKYSCAICSFGVNGNEEPPPSF